MPIETTIEIRCLCVFLISIFTSFSCYSSHIIGGDITYDFVRFNTDETEATYQVQMVLYRDPTGVRLDNFANFGVYKQLVDGSWETYKLVPLVERDVILEHDPLGDPCKTRYLSGEKLEYTNYTFELTLEISDQNYKIAYQKCCRNFTINNIFADGNIGAVYDVIITPESMRLGNSSPKFGPIPPLFVCSGFDLSIDHSATDSDGDLLVYKFCTPLHPGFDDGTSDNKNCCGCTNPDPQICRPDFPELVYEEGFSPQNPMRGDPQVTIDDRSGLITGRPELLGPYVIVVCVEEYRDGQLIGVVRRDFELNSIVCTDYLNAAVVSDSIRSDRVSGKSVGYFESCDEPRFSIVNLSRDETFIRNYIWEIYNENDELVYNRKGLENRDVTLDLPGSGSYYGYMILNDDETCADTAHMEFFVATEIDLDYKVTYNPCEPGPVIFENQLRVQADIASWYWDFGDGNFSEDRSPIHEYAEQGSYLVSLMVNDIYGCNTTFEKNVTYELRKQNETLLSEQICEGESYDYHGNSFSESGSYQFVFEDEFGCDSIVTFDLEVLVNSAHSFADTICNGDEYYFQSMLVVEAGAYTDTLVNSNGCDSIITLDLYVGENLTRLELDEPLVRDYGTELSLMPVVEGDELIYKQWYTEDFVLSNTLDLIYIVEKDDKLFFESINEIYCFAKDSVNIRSVINKGVYVPNIFSPNGDGDNDFFAVGFTKSLKLIGMDIFDRWGNLIYTGEDDSKSLQTHWDGTKNGAPVAVGVYAYLLEFEFVNGDRSTQSGTVQLIR